MYSRKTNSEYRKFDHASTVNMIALRYVRTAGVLVKFEVRLVVSYVLIKTKFPFCNIATISNAFDLFNKPNSNGRKLTLRL